MVSIRPATKEDFDFFFELKSEESNVFWTGGADKPKEENLRRFFYDAVDHAAEPQARKIYIIENEEGEKVGHLYIIPNGEEHDLPCAILSRYRGKGYAKQAINLGHYEGKRLGFKRSKGSIREDNLASMKAYADTGVKVTDEYKEVYIPKLGRTVKMYTTVCEYSELPEI